MQDFLDDEDDDGIADEAARRRKAKHRPIPKRPEGSGTADGETGRVIRVEARQAKVDIAGEIVECRMRGSLFLMRGADSKPLAVGDRVRVVRSRDKGAAIAEVFARTTELARPHADGKHRQVIAANLDQAIIISACVSPALNLRLLDRMLVAAERENFGAVIVLNKADLVDQPDVLREIASIYENLGYLVVPTSTIDGQGIGRLREALAGKTSVFIGMSGVGKSSLLNAIEPGLHLLAGEVSEATNKGRHTTTSAELLRLAGGGFVVDTPGVREFGMYGLHPEDLAINFRDFRPYINRCGVRTCLHEDEENCAVRDAVDEGEIHEERYDSYRRLIESVRADRSRGGS